jgi:hypothetical protein
LGQLLLGIRQPTAFAKPRAEAPLRSMTIATGCANVRPLTEFAL